MANDDAAAKAAAEKAEQDKKAAAEKAAADEQAKKDAAAKAAAEKASKTVVLVRETLIPDENGVSVPRPRGYELPADSDVVRRALAPVGLVQPKALFTKLEAARKAQAEADAATAEAAAEAGEGTDDTKGTE